MTTYDQYISWTGFKKFVSCPQSYYLEYIEDNLPKVRDERNTLRGNTMHTLLEEYIAQGVNNTSWLMSNVDRIWNELVSNSYVVWKHKDDEEQLKTKLYQWTQNLARILDELKIDVNKCQSEVKADSYIMLGKYKVKMGARVDLILKTKLGDTIFFDLKASENKSIMEFDQIVWYAIVMGLYLGSSTQPKYGGYLLPGFDYIKIYEVPTDAKSSLLGRLHKVVKQIDEKIWTPIPENSKCYRCPVKHACPLVGKALPHKSGLITLGEL